MIEIRPFSNEDLPKLAELWCIHHAAYRMPPAVTPAIFEQAVTSRLFFDPRRLLVAVERRVPVAWCQWFTESGSVASMPALCFHTHDSALNAARLLVAEVQRAATAAKCTELFVGVQSHSHWGYQGLEPIGHGIGIDVADDRTNTLLESLDFEEAKRLDRWEVNTATYRAPINRDMLSLRRTTTLQQDRGGLMTPHEAEAMVHLDIERHSLVDNRTRAVLAAIELWISDPDASVMPMTEAIIGNLSLPQRPEGIELDDTALRFLISALIPELGQRHIRMVQRSVATNDKSEMSLMQGTNFSRTSAGRVFRKSL